MADYLSQAKAYIRKRTEAELSFENNLEKLYDTYASKLIDIAYSANVQPTYFTFSYNKTIQKQVDALIDEFLSVVVDYTETLAIATHTKNKDKLMAYLGRDIAGETFYDRAKTYTQTFKNEIEGIVVAGLLIGALKTNIKQSIKTYRKMPYQNPIFKQAVKLNLGKAEALKTNGLHFGIGKSNSAFTSIDFLGRFTIGDVWMEDWYDGWNTIGAIGFNVINQAGACSECTDMAGFHTDGNLPLYHVNCRCIAVPVFRTDI
jgi:hypothetical protein